MGSRGEDRARQQNQIAAWWSAARTSDRTCRSWAERGLVRRWCGGRSQQDASRIRSKQFRSESSYLLLVGETGFEPATPWSRTRCSTRLSHSPKLDSPRGREEVTGRTEPVNAVVAGPAPACRSVLAGASCAAP